MSRLNQVLTAGQRHLDSVATDSIQGVCIFGIYKNEFLIRISRDRYERQGFLDNEPEWTQELVKSLWDLLPSGMTVSGYDSEDRDDTNLRYMEHREKPTRGRAKIMYSAMSNVGGYDSDEAQDAVNVWKTRVDALLNPEGDETKKIKPLLGGEQYVFTVRANAQ